jgi:hypothetical protein
MGFRLLPGVIATACRCLPHAQGKVRLPSPDDPGADRVLVRVRDARKGAVATGLVIAADPCADYALLAAPGDGAPGDFAALVQGLCPTALDWTPGWEGRAFVFTDERSWVDGICAGSRFASRFPSPRLRTRTSGAPIFNARGLVVGLVGHNDVREPDAAVCALADQLPGWALREARAAEARPEER